MVDVSEKAITTRTAVAKGCIHMNAAAATAIRELTVSKGDVLQIARIAAISAAKQTSQLIPLCHLLPLEKVNVDFRWVTLAQSDDEVLECAVEIVATAKTGVEMEALTATAIGLMTVYDMVKAIDREMRITDLTLWRKQGGVRGNYQRDENLP